MLLLPLLQRARASASVTVLPVDMRLWVLFFLNESPRLTMAPFDVVLKDRTLRMRVSLPPGSTPSPEEAEASPPPPPPPLLLLPLLLGAPGTFSRLLVTLGMELRRTCAMTPSSTVSSLLGVPLGARKDEAREWCAAVVVVVAPTGSGVKATVGTWRNTASCDMRLLLLWSEEVELSLRSALALLWLLLWFWFWLLVVVLLLLLPPLPEAADLAEVPADGEAEPPVGGPAPEEDFPGEDRLLPPPAVIPDLRLLGLALLLAWPPPPPDLSPLTLWKYKSDPL